jgi:hypothetical protein
MPTPSSFAIARQDVPEARNASTRDSATNTRGCPSLTPLAFALRSPAFTRSWIWARSNSAIAPMIWNMSRPAGRSGQIEVVAHRDESDTHRLELGQRIHQVLQGSGESVQLPDEQDIELPALSSGHHLVESRPNDCWLASGRCFEHRPGAFCLSPHRRGYGEEDSGWLQTNHLHSPKITYLPFPVRWYYPNNMDDVINRKFFADMGRKGGQKRAKKLTAEQRRKSAIKASKAAAKARTRKAKERKRVRESEQQ